MGNGEIGNIGALKANVTHTKRILRETSIFLNHYNALKELEKGGGKVSREEQKILHDTLLSLILQLRMINNSLPDILSNVSLFKELPAQETTKKAEKENLVSLSYKHPALAEGALLTIKKEDRARFLKELSLTENSIKRLKKEYKAKPEKIEEFKKPSSYAILSNKYFLKLSTQLLDEGYFKGLNKELRKSNLYFLSSTYISMAFLTSVISFFVAIFVVIFLLFFGFSLDSYFLFARVSEPILMRLLKTFWLIFVIPVLTFLAFYFYPSTERKSISGKINHELPFVLIHMSAIAGSGIEPTKIFRIVISSREYPHTRKEFKKLLNEINIYGYDLVTALRNIARVTSSQKLADVFNGLATTITSGGSLKEFLDKRAETLVFDYKLEMEKSTKMAETFMDLYISVVIAAPLIMTMLLVMIGLINVDFGLTPIALSLLMIFGVALINVVFLVFLHLKQPNL